MVDRSSRIPSLPSAIARRLASFLVATIGILAIRPAAGQEPGSRSFRWTPLDRIESITTPLATSTFRYDGDGLRTRKQTPAATVIYIRDAIGNVMAEYDPAGNLLAEYVYAGNRRIARLTDQGRERLYYHTDAVGSAVALTDLEGRLAWRGESLPFGEELESTGDVDDWKFAGKERDEGTGLHYFEARYFDAAIGRFLSVDEVGGDGEAPQTWNRYAYARNNPWRSIDPDGRQEKGSRVMQQINRLIQLVGRPSSPDTAASPNLQTAVEAPLAFGLLGLVEGVVNSVTDRVPYFSQESDLALVPAGVLAAAGQEAQLFHAAGKLIGSGALSFITKRAAKSAGIKLTQANSLSAGASRMIEEIAQGFGELSSEDGSLEQAAVHFVNARTPQRSTQLLLRGLFFGLPGAARSSAQTPLPLTVEGNGFSSPEN